MSIILQIKDKLQQISKERSPVVIIDIDGTILDNFPRQLAILKHVLEPKYNNLIGLSEQYKHLPENQRPYSILSLIKPQIQNEDIFLQIKRIFLDTFLSNQFLQADTLYPGIQSKIRKILKLNCQIWYLTGRPRTLMEAGTIQRFKRAKIPLDPIKTRLIMKDSPNISDETFKHQFFAEIKDNPKIEVVSLIDNEATMCNQALTHFPNGLIIHFLTQQSNEDVFGGFSLNSWK